MKNRSLLLKILYLLFLAALTACGDAFYDGGNTSSAGIVVKAFVYFLLFAVFFAATERFLTAAHAHNTEHSWHRHFSYSRKNILRLAFVFFSVYFIYLLVFYPGVTSGDTIYQIEDLVTGSSPMNYPVNFSSGTVSALMSDHHPVVTTLIFTFFYQIGLLLGNANLGLFLYNLLQCAAMSILFAVIVCYMDRLRVPKVIPLLCAFFYASPLIASFAIFMGKDSLFSISFVLYYAIFLDLLLTSKDNDISRPSWALLLLFSVIITLLNKKGIYLAVFSNLCLLLMVSRKKKLPALLAVLSPVLVVTILIQQLLFPLFDIVHGGKQEMLGVAFQQTSLSLLENPENYSEDEKALFFSLFEFEPDDLGTLYNPSRTDEIKNHFLQKTSQDAILSYLKMWARHFPSELKTYFRATLSVGGAYLAPRKVFNVYQYTAYSERLGAFAQPEATAFLRESLGGLFYWLENIPILSVFCQDSFYVFWIPSFALYHFFSRKQFRKVPLLAPLVLNLVFLVIGPVCITRYALCQLYTFPILLAITSQAD